MPVPKGSPAAFGPEPPEPVLSEEDRFWIYGGLAEPDMELDIITVDQDLKELMAVLTRDLREELREHEAEIMSTILALGGDGKNYRRDRKTAARAIVAEIYSPPRVTAAMKLLPDLRLIPGFALDLTTADVDGRLWDFDKEMRDRARRRLSDDKPMLLVGPPMCTAFSTWQRINDKIRDKFTVDAEKKRAIMHLEFCMELPHS